RLADAGLMAAESDLKPARRIERPGRFNRSADGRRERRANLSRREAVRKRAPKRHLREEMKRTEPVGERSADRRERAVRRDQPLLYRRVTACALLDPRRELLPRSDVVTAGIEDVEQHRVNHEAVVVIPVEFRTVAVHTIALVPLLVLTQRVVDPNAIPIRSEPAKRRF